MKNIREGTIFITAETDRRNSVIIDGQGRISFSCSRRRDYVETNIEDLTELIAMAIRFRNHETRKEE